MCVGPPPLQEPQSREWCKVFSCTCKTAAGVCQPHSFWQEWRANSWHQFCLVQLDFVPERVGVQWRLDLLNKLLSFGKAQTSLALRSLNRNFGTFPSREKYKKAPSIRIMTNGGTTIIKTLCLLHTDTNSYIPCLMRNFGGRKYSLKINMLTYYRKKVSKSGKFS